MGKVENNPGPQGERRSDPGSLVAALEPIANVACMYQAKASSQAEANCSCDSLGLGLVDITSACQLRHGNSVKDQEKFKSVTRINLSASLCSSIG